MIVCLCKGISDKKIRWLIQNGSRSLRDIMSSCQAGGDCGSCIFQVKEMLEEAAEEMHDSSSDVTGT